MTRKARDADQSTWGAWGTPYLNGDAQPHTPARPSAPPPAQAEAAVRPLSPEALRRAIQAEEQRQVFALLGRLRRSRPS
ncbi:hypothetical protein [Deinococcus arcticus]|uniref:hypothetical protein n=1 Tax=Deinococcus arcticus TaxID=2136176 RepID=UPI0011B2114A|nr:hypothetical protein [Deinococcus arcticus]